MAIFEWLWLVILIIIEVLWGTLSVMDIVKTIRYIKHYRKESYEFFSYMERFAMVWVIANTVILFMASIFYWALQH